MSSSGIVFIMGPTASGKTGLAVDLVDALNAEIVSVDSAMVYRGMDIGTAKPDAATLARAPHRLIDIRDPAEPYSAADFCRDARAAIDEIHAVGRLPLLVGGTSLYFRALEQGLSPMPGRDAVVRARLTREAQTTSWAAVHERLTAIDPGAAARIHPNDAQRIQRALEIHALTGQAPSALFASQRKPALACPVLKLAVAPASRTILHERIGRRFAQMMAEGFYQEVEKLYARPDLKESLPAVRAVGYRQLWQVLAGECPLDEGVERAVHASRQLAKRQLTWLRGDSRIHWFASDMAGLSGHATERISRWLNAA